jgi:MFS family permease
MEKGIQTESKKQPVIIVALVTAICLMGDSMLYIALPIYWKEVGLLSLWEVGLLLSVNRFVRLPLNPLIGWLYNKISLRTGLLIAVVLATLTTIGYGLASGLVMWLILRCVWGIAWSLLRLRGFFTVIRCAEAHNQGQFMGTYNGLYRLGSLFGMLTHSGFWIFAYPFFNSRLSLDLHHPSGLAIRNSDHYLDGFPGC